MCKSPGVHGVMVMDEIDTCITLAVTKKKLLLGLIKVTLGPVHMIPGQLIAPGQLTDLGVNFVSVHGLIPVTVHMSFSLPQGNFERRVTRCTTLGNPPC